MSLGRALLVVATLGAFALSIRSLFIAPVPLWLACIVLLLYLAYIFAGALFPCLELYADVVWRGPKSLPHVALTFDDGPHPKHTAEVLNILRDANATATFFVLGNKAKQYPELLQRIVREGHSIGIHGYHHDRAIGFRSTQRVVRDLQRTIDIVREQTNISPTLYRPPAGQITPRIAQATRQLGLTIVGWNARGFDGINQRDPKKVSARIAHRLRPGAIVLLHDAPEYGDRKPAGVEALEAILRAIDAQGLQTTAVQTFVDALTTSEN